jgi:hypothetical protein
MVWLGARDAYDVFSKRATPCLPQFFREKLRTTDTLTYRIIAPFLFQAAYISEDEPAALSKFIDSFDIYKKALQTCPRIEKYTHQILLLSDIELFPLTRQRAIAMRNRANPLTISDFGVSNWENRHIRCLTDALEILERIDRDELLQIMDVNPLIFIFNLDKSIGFVDVCCSGALFLRESEFSDPYFLAENFLHEGSHTVFNLWILENAPYVLEDTRLYTTPLRRDPRPVVGLLHQLYVLGRLKNFWSSDEITAHNGDNIISRLDRQIEGCLIALKDYERWGDLKAIWPSL